MFRTTRRLHLQGRRISQAKSQRERDCHMVSCLASSSALNMEATCFSETSVYFKPSTWRSFPDDRILHNYHCENLKSYKCYRLFKILELKNRMAWKLYFTCDRMETKQVNNLYTYISQKYSIRSIYATHFSDMILRTIITPSLRQRITYFSRFHLPFNQLKN
jgi:hypothetical protein